MTGRVGGSRPAHRGRGHDGGQWFPGAGTRVTRGSGSSSGGGAILSAHQMVTRMNAMFVVFPRYMPESARTQCWMCLKGKTSPEREPADRP